MNISIRRILFPTDFSGPAKEAQEYATKLAEQFDAELHLLHVVPPPMPSPHPATPWVTAENELRLLIELSDQRLAKVLCEKWSQEQRVFHTTVLGFSVEEILKYADVHKIDLIVLGTHGHTGLSHLLMGSVAEKVVRMAHCPVLTVHPQGHQFLVETKAEDIALSEV